MLYPQYPEAIETKYGAVRRARFCYLYTASGKRLTDLYQEAGRAILGWGGSPAGTAFKNAFNRGACGGFCAGGPEKRLLRAMQRLLPEVSFVRWYAGEEAARAVRAFPVWRPWQENRGPHEEAPPPAYVFLPPFPLAREAVILAALKDGGLAEKDAPGSALLPPPFLAGLARSVHDLVAEIPRRGETGWALYDGAVLRFWRRDGPYLFPKMPPQEYGAFAERCLEAGLVVSPDYDTPSIVPWQANKGDFSALCRQ